VVIFTLKHVISKENLKGYSPEIQNTEQEKEAIGFLDGLRLILTHPYVMGIFAIILFQEVISTLMGYQLSLLVKTTYQEPGLVNKFLFDFALCVQIIACLFGLVGTSFFQRKLGIRSSLIAYPLCLAVFVLWYIINPTLYTIFYVMLISKALGYALNQPAKEILYIPTSRSIKYKSKAWIDMFGVRFSKALGSSINRFAGPVVWLTGSLAFGFIAIWILCAFLLGGAFKRAVSTKKLIE
jgi:ATP:ADP antiporter, AAA family